MYLSHYHYKLFINNHNHMCSDTIGSDNKKFLQSTVVYVDKWHDITKYANTAQYRTAHHITVQHNNNTTCEATYSYTRAHIYTHADTYTHAHTYTNAQHIHIHTYIHTYTTHTQHMYTYTYIHIYMYIHMHTHMHIHMYNTHTPDWS